MVPPLSYELIIPPRRILKDINKIYLSRKDVVRKWGLGALYNSFFNVLDVVENQTLS